MQTERRLCVENVDSVTSRRQRGDANSQQHTYRSNESTIRCISNAKLVIPADGSNLSASDHNTSRLASVMLTTHTRVGLDQKDYSIA